MNKSKKRLIMIKSKRQVKIFTFPLVLLVSVVFTVVSCGDGGKVRKYKEKGATAKTESKSPHGTMKVPTPAPQAPTRKAMAHFKWETPEGWIETKASSSMRLATFTVKSGDRSSVCTIIPLQGTAGGVKANVSRWLGQVTAQSGHTDPMLAEGDPAEVQNLLKSQEKFLTKAKFPAVFFDFTGVTQDDAAPSILATMITVGGSTVFIKMTGPKAILVENKAKFVALCKSFDMGNPPAAEEKPAAKS
jgi:hypothetical protein